MVGNAAIKTVNLNCFYDELSVLRNLNIEIRKNEILGIIGPANSGKTTFLRAINRLNDLNLSYKQQGEILLEGVDVRKINANTLRKKVGIIFAMPHVLPMTIYKNIAYGPKVHGITNKKAVDEIVETSLQKAYLWDEVKDRLDTPATKLSGG
ncbi:MAG: ATP-binding cassette domain-containing protein, partial [Phycisphaerae bacterium]